MSGVRKIIGEKIIIFDGGMGTSIIKKNLSPDDFQGREDCNEYLVISRPDIISEIHASFLEAGCDVIETDTFNANRVMFADHGLAGRVYEINKKAARLARNVAKDFSTKSHPRFAAGSIGPGSKLPSIGHITFDELRVQTKEQAKGLIDGGVDILVIETCQDILQSKAAVLGCFDANKECNKDIPVILQFTFEQTGTMLLGTDIVAAVNPFVTYPLFALGLNCATGPAEMSEQIKYLGEHSPFPVSCNPNAGLPENVDGNTVYHLTPEDFADYLKRYITDYNVRIAGGCCGTTPGHLKALVNRTKDLTPSRHKPVFSPMVSSLYHAVTLDQSPKPLIIGERTNANGSRKFRELLQKEDYDAMVSMAGREAREGSHLLDVCVAFAGRDEKKDMREVMRRFRKNVTAPLVIDSTEADVIETALKMTGGRVIINSINLEDGGSRLRKVLPLVKEHGAAVIALTIDEDGMAKTSEKKFLIADRIYKIAVGEYKLPGDCLLFDPLTFTLGSGDSEYYNAGVETLAAIKKIKQNLPGAFTLLGVSNVSFGLKPTVRTVLNSVFLHHAIEAGLDAAIIHAKKIVPLYKIDKNQLHLAEDVIFNRRDKTDPLMEFMCLFDDVRVSKKPIKDIPLEERIISRVVDGEKDGLEELLLEARKKYSPIEIINRFLLDGMKRVGELFGAGQMQLPFVLLSAEVMKKAVSILEPFMDKSDKTKKGKIVIATVKGDVHDIGKNLVDIILTNNGYEVINIGIKQPVDNIIKSFEEHNADAIGMSGLLVKSTVIMKENLEEMNRRNIKTNVLLGGAALTRKFVDTRLVPAYRGKVHYCTDAIVALKNMDDIISSENVIINKISQVKIIEKEELPPDEISNKSSVKNLASAEIPSPPFFGSRVAGDIPLKDVYPYINEIALFRGQWQFRKKNLGDEEYDELIQKTVWPLFAKWKEKCINEKILIPKAVYGYYPCYSKDNSVVILHPETKKEIQRLDFPRQKKPPYLCISDYFLPEGKSVYDVIGFQVVTAGSRACEYAKTLFDNDSYTDYLYCHGISVETAEALAELFHKKIREELGISGGDGGAPSDLFKQKYMGSRYSFGYPACPDLAMQKAIFELLKPERIGVHLTEEFQLVPEQSTSAVIVHHPSAKYFSI